MQKLVQPIIAILQDRFPESIISPSYAKLTQIHYFQISVPKKDTSFSVVMPPGYLMTSVHVTDTTISFEVLIHSRVFIELYGSKLFIAVSVTEIN